MRKQLTLVLATISTIALVTGVAWASIPSLHDDTPSAVRIITITADSGSTVASVPPTTEHPSTSTTIEDMAPTTIGESTSTTVEEATSTTLDDTTSTTLEHATTTTLDDTTSTTLEDATTSTTIHRDDDAAPAPGSQTVSVGGVATVTFSWANDIMWTDSVWVAHGWKIDRQEAGSERLRIDFENGHDHARFEARFEDGSIRIETRVG
jgi:hypothetical protein